MRLACLVGQAVVAGVLFSGGLWGVGANVAAANVPIKPGQHFLGLVNGANDTPTVHTVCPGPTSLGRHGPVADGQTLSVARVARGGGKTGLFSQIYAWFAQDNSGPPPQQVKFVVYGVSEAIPAAVRVPCDGTGQVEFSSCPYLAPCAAGWVPDSVTVRFVNIAVAPRAGT